MEIKLDEIKKKLTEIYTSYLANPDNEEIKKRAGDVYNQYKGLNPMLKPEISLAINKLVDIGFDTGLTISQKEIKEMLNNLQK